MLSLVIPVYKNSQNIPFLLDAIADIAKALPEPLEAVFVVDASPDDSYAQLAARLSAVSFASKLLCLSKNEGSFIAIRAGLEAATGSQIAVMAADLQEPPSLVPMLFAALADGQTDIALGVRGHRHDPAASRLASRLYWWLYRICVMRAMPRGGFDIFACSRSFRDRILSLNESHSSLVSQIIWLSGRRKELTYERQVRQHGKSAWTLRKKWTYLMDSVFSFSYLPIQLLMSFGATVAILSAFLGCVVVWGRLTGSITVPGYTALCLLISFFGSMTIFSLGVVGNYAWRTYENTKQRPLYNVAAKATFRARDAAAEVAP